MAPRARLRCLRCNTEMNRHAEKLVHPERPEDQASVDPSLGGILEETHACPRCGNVESRRVTSPE